ncbi:MAG: DNA primase [Rickettsiaceae bacterium]|nr:DNA primase [Rickettsiaceae bacterium]
MKNILNNFYDQIREKVLVSEIIRSYISLTKKGYEFLGLCPFHNEKSPSFTVNDQKKFYHCFGCGAHGDVIKFESELSGVNYKDAAYKIAAKAGIKIPIFSESERKEIELADKLSDLMQQACRYYSKNLGPQGRKILHERGVNEELINTYNLGYAQGSGLIEYFSTKKIKLEDLASCGLVSKKENGRYKEFFSDRITIPIITTFGRVIGFGGRSLGQEMPKYINSPETILFKKGEALFGENIAYSSAHKTGSIILVEGYFDAIALHQKGFKNVVASLGTAVTHNQVTKLWKIASKVIVCLDGDSAGIRAAKKLLDIAIEHVSSSKQISFICLPSGMDPDDFVAKYGKDGFARLLENQMSLSEFIFSQTILDRELKTPENRAEIEVALDSYIAKIQDVHLKQNMKRYFSDMLWNLFSSRKNKLPNKISQSANQLNNSTSSALENIDDQIISLIVMNFSELDTSRITSALETIYHLSHRVDLIEYLLQLLDELDLNRNTRIERDKLENNLKKTRFCDVYDLLCMKYRRSFSGVFVNQNIDDILEYLLSKRYLHVITEEFKNIMLTNAPNIDAKISFYLNEIKSVQTKISKFDMRLADQ